MRQDHNRTQSLSCTMCKKKYPTKENLQSHIHDKHKKKYDCDSCEQSFPNETDLKSHDNNDHTSEYNCEQCDHQATTQTLLDKHIQFKHTQKNFDCKGVGSQKCDNTFNNYDELMDQRRDHHKSGNVTYRYFKLGTCHYMNDEKGGCWYLHTETTVHSNSGRSGSFDC